MIVMVRGHTECPPELEHTMLYTFSGCTFVALPLKMKHDCEQVYVCMCAYLLLRT